jgi:hypothetical protein
MKPLMAFIFQAARHYLRGVENIRHCHLGGGQKTERGKKNKKVLKKNNEK